MWTVKRWFKQKPRVTRAQRARLLLEKLEDRLAPATITVTTAADVDSGTGAVSLREAIKAIDAGSYAGYPNIQANIQGTFGQNDTIKFDIPGSGVQTITVSLNGTPLPQLTRPMTIDGYSQPGASPNTLTSGDNAVVLIDLNGSSIPNTDGLDLSGGGITVRGLAIQGFTYAGFNVFTGGNNVIAGCFIGTNAAGTAASASQYDGFFINGGSNDNTVGGTTPAARNVISGNNGNGVLIDGNTSGNVVEGNYIGTNAAGTAALANGGDGVVVGGGATSNTIGGTTAAACNVISGNAQAGVAISDSATQNNTLEGNYIGTNAAGTAALANGGDGVAVQGGAANNTIGGTTAAACNVISGNARVGVEVSDGGTKGNLVEGNLIGTNAAGTGPLPNGTEGVVVTNGAINDTIGGVGSGTANTIAYNTQDGVVVGDPGFIAGSITTPANSATNQHQVQTLGFAYFYPGERFTLSYIGYTTATLSYTGTANTDASAIQSALNNALATLGPNYVSVAPATNNGNVIPGQFWVTFNGLPTTTQSTAVLNGTITLAAVQGITVRGNLVYGNGTSEQVLTTNGNGDGDADQVVMGLANHAQAAPSITSATLGAATTIRGAAAGAANTALTLDFYAYNGSAPLGETYLGSATVTTDASGNATFNATFGASSSGQWIVATATDPAGDTSADSFFNPSAAAPGTAWTALGPASINGNSPGIPGDLSGRITGIAADPTNANIIYIAAASGGIWKTTNGGGSWVPLTDHLTDASGNPIPLFMGSVAVDPLHPNIVYAGTGEANPDNSDGRGVLKSTDGGATWTLLDDGGKFERTAIGRIVIDPSNDNNVWVTVNSANTGASSNNGIYESTDGGNHWANTTASPFVPLPPGLYYSDLVLDPNNPSTLYMAVGNAYVWSGNAGFAGVYKWTNSAGPWTPLSGVPSGTSDGRITLALSSDSSTLYVSIATPWNSTSYSGLYRFLKITNGGTSVTDLTSKLPAYLYPQGNYDTTLAVEPGNPDIVFAGGTSDGKDPGLIEIDTTNGINWSNIQSGNGFFIHSDDHALAFDAAGRLLDGNDGGIFRLDNSTIGSLRWTDLNANLEITQVYGLAVDPTNVVYAGSQDNGNEKTGGTVQFNNPLTWNLLYGGDGGFPVLDPFDPSTVYIEAQGPPDHLYRSNDGGNTFTPLDAKLTPGNWMPPLVTDPLTPNRVLYGTTVLYESFDQGNSWTTIAKAGVNGFNNTDSNGNIENIDAVAIAPTDPNTIYVLTDGDNLYVTTNGLSASPTWQQYSIPGYTNQNQVNSELLAVDPANAQVAYVVSNLFASAGNPFTVTGSGGHVFETTNGGQNWTDISTGLLNVPVFSIVVDPRGPVYVGTDVGVYDTLNGGTTWSRFGSGLPNAQINDMQIVPNLGLLAVAAYGRGVFETKLASGTFTVTNLNDSGPGSLRQAILDSNSAGGANTIDFTGVATSGTITLTSGALPTLTASVVITGPGANALTINGNNAAQVFTVNGGITVSVTGLTIKGGHAGTNYGGAMVNWGDLTVSDCTFANNSAAAGGAICNNTTLTVLDSTFTGNVSTVYGGGAIENFGTLLIVNGTLAGNTSATYGGAIESSGGTLAVDSSTITANRCAASGGGMSIGSGTTAASLLNTIVDGNTDTGSGQPADDLSGNLNYAFADVIGTGPSNASSITHGNQLGVSVAAAGLMPLGNYGGPTQTVALLPTSVAVGTGNGGVLFYTTSALGGSAADTRFTVDATTFLAPGMVIAIDSEQMLIDSIAGTTVTVTRAVNGTTVAAHANGAAMYLPADQRGIRQWGSVGAYQFVGYTPGLINSAYGISGLPSGDNGAGQTIAIIIQYDDPALVDSTDPNFDSSDLHIFDEEFGLPDPPSFRKVSQTGSSTGLPPPSTQFGAGEIALDVESAHAIAPMANIELVECVDSYQGIRWAATPASGGGGATVVSMSWTTYGGYATETTNDSSFNPASYPGVTFVAGVGDLGDSLSSVTGATPAATGSGYAVGDVLTLVGGTPDGPPGAGPAMLRVTGVNAGGGITQVTVAQRGIYVAPLPSNTAVPVSGGSGSGATFDLSTMSTNNQVGYPSDSPDVIAVSGTSLQIQANGAWGSESVWNDGSGASGGGISNYEGQPTYQQGLRVYPGGTPVPTNGRAGPDVAFDGDQSTPGIYYDSWDGVGQAGSWFPASGASYGTPCWAALVAIADQIRAAAGESPLASATQTLPILYELYNNPTAYAQDFHDIVSGTNGTFAAGAGFDLDTGIGTPIANNLVPALADVNQLLYEGGGGTNNYALSENGGVINLSDNGVLVATQPINLTQSINLSGGAIANVTASLGSAFNVNINGPTGGTTYTQLAVGGAINLAGAILQLSGSFAPSVGETFTVVTGTSVSSTFANLPDNTIIAFNNQDLRINYTGTSVTLTDVAAITATTVVASVSGNTSTYGATVTFTATVSNDPSNQGTVTFDIDGSPYAPATNLSLNSSGQASFSINSLSVTGSPHTITASFSGEAGLCTASQGSVQLTVDQATPTISWQNPANITYGTALGASQLDASANVPGTFSYTLADGATPAFGVVLQAGANQVLRVVFTPSDSADYTTATDSVVITVLQVTPQITWTNPADITFGTPLGTTQLDASANVSGTLGYTLADGKTSANGVVLLAGAAQTLQVAFTPNDRTDYTGATDSVSINVLRAAPSVTWSNPANITYGTALGSTQLDATANASGTFSYTLANGTTSAAGAVLQAGAGQTLKAFFTPTDTADYTSAAASVVITVLQATPTLTWSNPADITYGTALGAAQLDAAANVAGTFSYTLANGTTPAAGVVLPAGSAQSLKAVFTPSDTTDYTLATASVQINVRQATPSITWSNPASISYGTALGVTQLDATAKVPGTFSYTLADGTTAAGGAILSAGVGQTLHVAFAPTDSADYTSAAKSVTITVVPATPTITWTNPADIIYGTALGAVQLDATASVPGSFRYTLADGAAPASGAVLRAGPSQTLKVAFTPNDNTDYTPATASVVINVTPATPIITWSNPADITYGTPLGATQLDAAATVLGSFGYTLADGTTSGGGAVLGAGAQQTLNVHFVPSDANDFDTASDSVLINVAQAVPTFTNVSAPTIRYGSDTTVSGHLNANAGAQPVPHGETVQVTLNGTTQNASLDTADDFTATFNTATWGVAGSPYAISLGYAGDANFASATANSTLTIEPATPALTWTNPANITYGTPLGGAQLNASANVPGTFHYTLTDGVTPASGAILQAGAGQTLRVAFTPTDSTDFAATTARVVITVAQATPTITWRNPADITYGAALGSTQLDATADVPGTFTYTLADGATPADGAVLGAGAAQQLKVQFTPTDGTDFTTATASVAINVLQATPALTWADPASITYGTPLSTAQLDASANVPGTFHYTLVDGVTSADGVILDADNHQSLRTTFTPADSANYTTATASVDITVTQAVPSFSDLAVPPTPFGDVATITGHLDADAGNQVIPAGETVQVALGGIRQAEAFDTSDDFTATFATDGLGVANSPYAVSVSYAGDGNFTSATAGSSLTIDQASQTITFAPPAAVAYGTPLTLSAMGGDSGNPVIFSVISGPATLTGSTLTPTAPGTVVVEADQAGDVDYLAAPAAQRTIVVTTTTQASLTQYENGVPSTVTVRALLAGQFSDPDGSAYTRPGIAVIETAGSGTWQASIGGGTWTAIPPVTPTQALLLSIGASLRFVPAPNTSGQATLDYVAWDGSQGRAGATADTVPGGGAAAFSGDAGGLSVSVNPVPAWGGAGASLPSIVPGSYSVSDATTPAGASVAEIFGASFQDADPNVSVSIAVSHLTGSGTWQYSTDGASWLNFAPAPSLGRAVLLTADDWLRFVPNASYVGVATLTAYAWDGSGSSGTTANLAQVGLGGASGFSATPLIATAAINRAPSLRATALTGTPVVAASVGAPITVRSLLAGAGYGDPDGTGLPQGIAITAVTAGGGTFQYLLPGGTWTALPDVAPSAALLLPSSAALRLIASDRPDSATLMFAGWDETQGVAGQFGEVTSDAASAFSTSLCTLSIAAEPDAPSWSASTGAAFTAFLPGSYGVGNPTAPAGNTIAAVFGAYFRDADPSVSAGVAVVGVRGDGTWQYSTNAGTSWSTILNPSRAQALLLSATDWLRFVPATAAAGMATVTAYAWDGRVGTVGTPVNVTALGTGGSSAFSAATLTANCVINTAPTLVPQTGLLASINQNTASAPMSVATLLSRAGYADADGRSVPSGIAITDATGGGTWQWYNGSRWMALPSVSSTAAFLLPSGAALHFKPAGNLPSGTTGSASLTYHAWDQTEGVAGTLLPVTSVGGASAFSTAEATAELTVNYVKQAPAWQSGVAATFTPVVAWSTANPTPNPPGDTVSAVFGPAFFGAAGVPVGVAITALGETSVGVWQYSLDDGGSWSTIAARLTDALLLPASARLRFVPNRSFSGIVTLTAYAWDGTGEFSGTADLTKAGRGGSSAFSGSALTATCLVNSAPALTSASV